MGSEQCQGNAGRGQDRARRTLGREGRSRTRNEKKSSFEMFMAGKSSIGAVQDKARAGRHKEGKETVNMKQLGRRHCWARAVLGLERRQDKKNSSGQALYDSELNHEFICVALNHTDS